LTAAPLSPIWVAVGEEFEDRLRAAAAATDQALKRLLAAGGATPERLLAAMRYAALGPGKRLRPFLLTESARLLGRSDRAVAEAAAALECVHAYSLAHDDLPAMDDDDLRRGRPTLHRAFDEATAILAGDGLLTFAFAVLARLDAPEALRLALIAGLAEAAGPAGMVGGQMLDIAAEGKTLDEAAVRRLQAMKTGALLRFAAEAGAILAGAGAEARTALATFGERIGLAFQLADDLIDATGSTAAAGKATAKDAARGKATLVALRGVAGARALLGETVGEAVAALGRFGPEADTLRAAARFVAERES
jgi:farnesyl diphosphate synthase